MPETIQTFNTYRVDLPLVKPFLTSKKRYSTLPYIIVEAVTDAGRKGYGETREATQITGEIGEAILALISGRFVPALKGCDPFDIGGIHAAMDEVCCANTAAKSAVDMAVYDLMGQLAGLPLYRLLGGGQTGRVQTSKAVGLGDSRHTLQEAQTLVEEGYSILKLKTGVDPDAEIRMIRDVRRAVGDAVRLKLDANQGWSLPQALKVLDAVADCDIEVVEQPLPAWDLKGSAELRRRIRPPVMLDEGVHSAHDVLRIIETGAADMINIKLLKSGGLCPALAMVSVAEAAGMVCQVGSLDTTIGTAAAAHLALARRSIRYAEINGPTRLKEDVATGLSISGGWVTVAPEPGLGIRVDTARLRPTVSPG